MNNETIKKFNITIKLRGDNVYDLYMDGKWVSSHGNCDRLIKDVGDMVKETLM